MANISSHGTTVIWVQTPDHTLVAFDAKATIDEPLTTTMRAYQVCSSDSWPKLVSITEQYHASTSGYSGRVYGLIGYLRHEIRNLESQGEVTTLKMLGDISHYYLKTQSPLLREEWKATIDICGWNPQLEKYQVLEVGDHMQEPEIVPYTLFGNGSGSGPVLDKLRQ